MGVTLAGLAEGMALADRAGLQQKDVLEVLELSIRQMSTQKQSMSRGQEQLSVKKEEADPSRINPVIAESTGEVKATPILKSVNMAFAV